MFREKPTAYDRVHDAIASLGERIGELEEQVVERFDPTPSRSERVRRAVGRYIPGYHEEPTGLSRYVPDIGSYWPKSADAEARRQVRALRASAGDLRDRASELGRSAGRSAEEAGGYLGGYLEGVRDHLPELRLPRRKSFKGGMKTQRGIDRLRDNPETTALLVIGGVVVIAGAAWFVTKKLQEHAEEPDYDVVRDDGDIQIRDYDAMLVAETIKSGYHEKARRVGFETLADYIFAKNRSGKKIHMTTPVLQQLAEGDGRTKGWAIRFVMPKKFTKATLPEPASHDVAIKDVPARRMAAIRFNGNFNATLASKHLMSLYNYLADSNLKQKGDPEYAFYNPPWTPGFMKRNEILIEIER
ncbi:heme-binding protein [Jiella sp. M17.18]|uniref:SOUL family heme-binding protein n=1 Tax=Jiella sp. M17.18 TaxID=3234247 RepID=UPI0034DEA371